MRKLQLGMTALALCLLGFSLARYVGREGRPVPVHLVPQPSQPRVSAGEAGLDPAALEAAAAYAGAHHTQALVVGRNGHIVYEKYWGDTGFDSPVDTGFAPVLTALAVGSALNDHLVHSLDEPLANYIDDLSEPEKTFTLRELLARDRSELSVQESTDLLALALERVTTQPYQTLVTQRIWSPLGAGDLEFQRGESTRRPDGVSAGCCLRARIGDWMRVGELLLNDGIFEGNQLTPPRYIELMMKPAHKDAPRGYFTRVDGSFATHDVVWLEGTNKQRLWIVPSLRLLVLRIGAEPSSDWDEAMIPDSIIRGTSGWHPPKAGEGTDPNKYAPH
jgi:CubicO group peptidase (beta-lactamase class C family)